MAYVELRGLAKRFGLRPAVRGLELALERGELVSLLGPSGCGKTTTLRLVAGFETPDAGEIWVGGQDLLALPAHRRGMGVVFQSYALFPHLTAWGNVAFGMKIAGRPTGQVRRRVQELLALVGLEDLGSRYPRELSGGQQQRVALARALAIEPRMLLLDEPLSALDAVVRVTIREEIRRIQSTLGVTTLYVTHDQEEALAISDRVVVMVDGAIEQVGTPEAIPSMMFQATVAAARNMPRVKSWRRSSRRSVPTIGTRVSTTGPVQPRVLVAWRGRAGAKLTARPARTESAPRSEVPGWRCLQTVQSASPRQPTTGSFCRRSPIPSESGSYPRDVIKRESMFGAVLMSAWGTAGRPVGRPASAEGSGRC